MRVGRRLGFAQYGNTKGRPVFFFHGAGGSRLQGEADETALEYQSIHMIATDRPGHGLSDPQPGRALLDWPADVAQLADHLGIDRFYVLGCSSGGPYALACAYKLPERVRAGAIVSGVAPPERPHPYRGMPLPSRVLLFGERTMPPLVYVLRRMTRSMIMGDPMEAGRKAASFFPRVDRDLVKTAEAQARFGRDVQEGYRQGWEGPAEDDILVNRPWGFALEEIDVRIDVWQGKADKMVPINHAHYQFNRIRNCRLHLWQDKGHLQLLTSWGEVFSMLIP
jgi:pimeloyl-ACP methyl ester carboxylesterase